MKVITDIESRDGLGMWHARGRRGMYIKLWRGNLEERTDIESKDGLGMWHARDITGMYIKLSVDGRIIFKWTYVVDQ